ncbi:hypothetical protein G4V62_04730 [Bacillaceae bacterium SIJ1]|uniref:hypothetical protein n=1 Tax=Litoribacterium kuwaitense TaxID=1398745 RepID=UPI0013E9A63B|nr:hypothetical protein [Litoribacterium kuwaitense]NGP44291.1 hypothetical protein [Litoribacterium kuwaitense]
MDDQQLEKQLQQLKNTYNQMPRFSDQDKIMKEIQQERREKPAFKVRRFRKAPLIASIAGLVVIGGMLGNGLLQSNLTLSNSSENSVETTNPQFDVELDNKFDALVQELFIEKLQLSKVPADLEFIKEAEKFAAHSKEKLSEMGEEEAEALYRISVEELEKKLESPAETIQRLTNSTNLGVDLRSDELTRLVKKQMELRPLLASHMGEWSEEALTSQGYTLQQTDLQIDWSFLDQTFRKITNEKISRFIQLQNHVVTIQAENLSWNDLSDRIVDIEWYLQTFPQADFMLVEKMLQQYHEHLYLYLGKGESHSSFQENGYLKQEVQSSYERFLINYPNTLTFFTVQSFYSLLENNGFQTSEEVQAFVVNGLAQNLEVERSAEDIQEPILPLKEPLDQRYEKWKLDQSAMSLEKLLPIEVAQFFAKAIEENAFDLAEKLVVSRESEEINIEKSSPYLSPYWLTLTEGKIKTLPDDMGKILMWVTDETAISTPYFVRFLKDENSWKIDWDALLFQARQ